MTSQDLLFYHSLFDSPILVLARFVQVDCHGAAICTTVGTVMAGWLGRRPVEDNRILSCNRSHACHSLQKACDNKALQHFSKGCQMLNVLGPVVSS